MDLTLRWTFSSLPCHRWPLPSKLWVALPNGASQWKHDSFPGKAGIKLWNCRIYSVKAHLCGPNRKEGPVFLKPKQAKTKKINIHIEAMNMQRQVLTENTMMRFFQSCKFFSNYTIEIRSVKKIVAAIQYLKPCNTSNWNPKFWRNEHTPIVEECTDKSIKTMRSDWLELWKGSLKKMQEKIKTEAPHQSHKRTLGLRHWVWKTLRHIPTFATHALSSHFGCWSIWLLIHFDSFGIQTHCGPKHVFFALLVRGHRPSSTHSYISYVWQGCVSVTTVL